MQERDWQCNDRTKIKKTYIEYIRFLGASNVEICVSQDRQGWKSQEGQGGKGDGRRTRKGKKNNSSATLSNNWSEACSAEHRCTKREIFQRSLLVIQKFKEPGVPSYRILWEKSFYFWQVDPGETVRNVKKYSVTWVRTEQYGTMMSNDGSQYEQCNNDEKGSPFKLPQRGCTKFV